MGLRNNYIAMDTRLLQGEKQIKIYEVTKGYSHWVTVDQVIKLQNQGVAILFLDTSFNIKDNSKISKVRGNYGCVAFVKEPPYYLWGYSELYVINQTTRVRTVLINFPYKIVQGQKIRVERVRISQKGAVGIKIKFADKKKKTYKCRVCVPEGGVHNTPQLLFMSQSESIYF